MNIYKASFERISGIGDEYYAGDSFSQVIDWINKNLYIKDLKAIQLVESDVVDIRK